MRPKDRNYWLKINLLLLKVADKTKTMLKFRIAEKVTFIINYFNYIIRSAHRKGHGIHSPFVYDFAVNVLFDKKYYPEYYFISSVRKELLDAEVSLEVSELGASSKKFRGKSRKVRDLAKISSVDEKSGRLLFRLAHYYKPATILELGTSIGLGTIYLAKGWDKSKVYTIEGNSTLCTFAKALFIEKEISNIEVINGLFDEKIKSIVPALSAFPLVFLDGNHRYRPTLDYFQYLSENLDEYILVFDDISWSKDMRNAWKDIVDQSRKDVTIDLFSKGIIIRKKHVTPGFYCIRF
jgi:predicted O-methyltransferase YrrM